MHKVVDMKTEELFEKYLRYLAEQDATEEMDATDTAEQPAQPDVQDLTSEGEKYLIDLMVKAFLHVPDESEGKIVKELQASLLDINPKGVLENIENMLELSPVDTKSMLDLTTDINS